MSSYIKMWTCYRCGAKYDRDINAAINIRNEVRRMVAAGIVANGNEDAVSLGAGRKSKIMLALLKLETLSFRMG